MIRERLRRPRQRVKEEQRYQIMENLSYNRRDKGEIEKIQAKRKRGAEALYNE